MRAFADLLETTAAAAASADQRNLTTVASVKTSLKITDSASDDLIAKLIVSVTKLIVDGCRLATDGAGALPTFGRETLRATWMADPDYRNCRGHDLYLPWRLPVSSIDSVTEDGTALVAGTDYVVASSMAGRLRRISGDVSRPWCLNKIVVIFKAGFALPVSTNIDPALEAAALEQIKASLFAADRDPNIRSEAVSDVGQVSYTVTGGDIMGARVLLPSVRDMLVNWRNPAP